MKTGETATERNARSIEPRETAAHSLKTFQYVHVHNHFTVTLRLGEPIWGRNVPDIDDCPKPAEVSSGNLCRGRRVKIYAEVRGLQKSVCLFAVQEMIWFRLPICRVQIAWPTTLVRLERIGDSVVQDLKESLRGLSSYPL